MAIIADLAQDVRYTLRQLRRSPLFALTATLSLAVGIGANAALFTLVDRLLWRPLPVAHPEELVLVTDPRSRVERSPRYSYPFYTTLAHGRGGNPQGGLQGVAAHFGLPLNAAVAGAAARVNGELVSGSYFAVLGARHAARPPAHRGRRSDAGRARRRGHQRRLLASRLRFRSLDRRPRHPPERPPVHHRRRRRARLHRHRHRPPSRCLAAADDAAGSRTRPADGCQDAVARNIRTADARRQPRSRERRSSRGAGRPVRQTAERRRLARADSARRGPARAVRAGRSCAADGVRQRRQPARRAIVRA